MPVSNRDSNRLRRASGRRRAARATIHVLPTVFTLGNVLSGFAAIFLASRPADAALPLGWTGLTFAASCVFLGMVFDGLDGRVARLTRNTSDLGEQLDSMADMVTFGVAPAFIAVQLVNVGTPFLGEQDMLFGRFTLAVAGIYVCCTALRLARYNIELNKPEEKHHASFTGLPSPGAAGTVASLVLLQQHFLAHRDPAHWSIQVSSYAMVAITLLVAIAMVSRLRYVHIANRFFRGQAKFNTIVWVVIVVLLLGTYPQASLAFAGVTYALSAPVAWMWRRIVKSQKLKVEAIDADS